MRIYVGNLSERTTHREIREVFTPYGQVSRVGLARDKKSGLRRGFGVVEMDRPEEGESAIAELHGSLLGDRRLKVRKAKTKR